MIPTKNSVLRETARSEVHRFRKLTEAYSPSMTEKFSMIGSAIAELSKVIAKFDGTWEEKDHPELAKLINKMLERAKFAEKKSEKKKTEKK